MSAPSSTGPADPMARPGPPEDDRRDPGPPPARPEITALPDYSSARAGSVPITIRASSNEAPFGPGALVVDAVTERLRSAHRYPELGAVTLTRAIAEQLGLDPDQVVAADGSLSLLNYLLISHCRPGSTVVHPWRSYEAYPICIRTAHAEPRAVANLPDGSHDLAAMAAAIGPDTAAVILCSPNNPTGAGLSHDAVAAFLAEVPPSVLVVLDQAYVDFVTDPQAVRGLELLPAHPNLVLLRTLSKAYGLAGLRIGHLLAHPQLCRAVRKIVPPFAVSALAETAALAALVDLPHRDRIVTAVIDQRGPVTELLRRHGLPVVPSEANFVWLPLGDRAAEFGARCADAGLGTRVFDGEGVRISLGEPDLPNRLSSIASGLPEVS